MATRCALIHDGTVINVIMAGPTEYNPEAYEIVASDTANIVDTYIDGVFTSPEEAP
jgi:hypothetical protein